VDGREKRAGVVLGLGILVKFFPGVILVVAWKFLTRRRALMTTGLALGVALIVYGALWAFSPQFTRASLLSQASKGSWETIWAMLDGNYRTGNFGPVIENLDAEMAFVRHGNPARVPTWMTLLILGGLGAWRFLRLRGNRLEQWIGLLGLTWSLFFLWSPGWSTQWVLYLLPWVILALDDRLALLLTIALVMVNLMEWPILLSRGWFWSLPLTIGLRTLLLVFLAFVFDPVAQGKTSIAKLGF
jgi:hypothetical protein